ncbi:uncharacterized protein LOC124286598 [Haliotis rubra]|uniref:uncharacterized protein LOC124286598 n=1 Tax=Haliotis rubra TaxID=36100 RepID=UPI001EE54B35|nr:uncharacterized protein LOC124286598 [Haliotis rubra]XP_046578931.1 uncharacterized protein LOC124286598 [Haliotis rubra]
MFSVVHFEKEDCVECVPTSWIDGDKCYWPLGDAKSRIRNRSIPDTERWSKYRIRRLGKDYPDYGTARKYCKRAEDTSNLESEDESRRRKRPHRLISENEAADEWSDEDEPTMAAQTDIPSLPKPTKQIPTSTDSNEKSTTELLQQVLAKLDKLENDMKIFKRQFRTETEDQQVDDLLPAGQKLDKPCEMDDFEKGLDEESRRKLINSLASLQGGNDAGVICRTLMRALMTNNLMSHYSGTGQKGKLAFIGKPIYRIITSAARKASGKTLAFHDIRSEMLEVLRNAPNKPGGANYVKKHQQKARQTVVTDEADEADSDN